jgi:signal transduction histidine kinase
VTYAGDGLKLEIEDHGGGLPADSARTVDSGLGLVSMRERAELMGGQLRLQRPAHGGLAVEVRVPNCLDTTRPAGGAVA